MIRSERREIKCPSNTRSRFKKNLIEGSDTPRVPSAKLHGSKDRDRIKLRNGGYRLVYEVPRR